MGKDLRHIERHQKAWRSVLEACARAAEILKQAGFEFRHYSRKSEACYYGWPGVAGTIRVAAHKRKKKNHRAGDGAYTVISKITVGGAFSMYSGGVLALPDAKLQSLVAHAIGFYFIHAGMAQGDAAGFKPPLLQGSIPYAGTNYARVAKLADAPHSDCDA